MKPPRQHDVQRLYRSGVDAVVATTAGFDNADWCREACGTWTATETARHLLAVARWFDGWLDRAVQGNTDRPFPESEIHQRNADELSRLTDLDGPTAVGLFAEAATHYVDRVSDHWDITFAYPFGVVTAGLHCGVAAAEWHLHASDLAVAVGIDLGPDEPRLLFRTAGACVAAAAGGVRGAVLGQIVPLAAHRSPWESMLRQSGRAEPTSRAKRTAAHRED